MENGGSGSTAVVACIVPCPEGFPDVLEGQAGRKRHNGSERVAKLRSEWVKSAYLSAHPKKASKKTTTGEVCNHPKKVWYLLGRFWPTGNHQVTTGSMVLPGIFGSQSPGLGTMDRGKGGRLGLVRQRGGQPRIDLPKWLGSPRCDRKMWEETSASWRCCLIFVDFWLKRIERMDDEVYKFSFLKGQKSGFGSWWAWKRRFIWKRKQSSFDHWGRALQLSLDHKPSRADESKRIEEVARWSAKGARGRILLEK